MPAGNYASINGLNMYYELCGNGKPLVIIHGGGSTIETTFGRVLPLLAEKIFYYSHRNTGTRPDQRPKCSENI